MCPPVWTTNWWPLDHLRRHLGSPKFFLQVSVVSLESSSIASSIIDGVEEIISSVPACRQWVCMSTSVDDLDQRNPSLSLIMRYNYNQSKCFQPCGSAVIHHPLTVLYNITTVTETVTKHACAYNK